MVNIPTIKEVIANSDYSLTILFDNNIKKVYPAKNLQELNYFHILSSYSLFSSFKIEPGGYAISWNDEYDLSENELWQNGQTI